ncbi:MAG: MFS transporter [Bacillota bacterium]|nr:MFS transporter [Bacillota bacterium]
MKLAFVTAKLEGRFSNNLQNQHHFMLEMIVRMFFIFTAYFLSIMNLTSIKILLPDIMADLGVSLNWLTWVVNAYTLPVAALIPIAGRVGDMYGPRRFFLAGLFVLGIGSLLCGTAFSLSWLLVGRVVQALGAAMLVPNSLAILLSKTEEGQRGKILGIWGSIGAAGAVIGPVVSGYLADLFSWRGSFQIIAVVAVIIVIAAGRQMIANKELGTYVRGTKGNFDVTGALLLISSTATLLLGITLLPDWGWQNNWIRISMVAFVLMIYAFYRTEKASSDPLLSPVLMRDPRFNLGLFVGFIEQFVVAGTVFVMPIFFNTVQGQSASATALLLTPAAITVALVSPVGGRIADRFGPGLPILFGMIIRSGSFLMLSQITTETAYPFIAVGLALNGLGFALTHTPALYSVLSTVSSNEHGITSGVHNMVRFTGAAAGTTIGGIILYALMPASFEGLTGPIPGFRDVYYLTAAVCLPGVAAGVYLTWLRRVTLERKLILNKLQRERI